MHRQVTAVVTNIIAIKHYFVQYFLLSVYLVICLFNVCLTGNCDVFMGLATRGWTSSVFDHFWFFLLPPAIPSKVFCRVSDSYQLLFTVSTETGYLWLLIRQNRTLLIKINQWFVDSKNNCNLQSTFSFHPNMTSSRKSVPGWLKNLHRLGLIILLWRV